MIETPTSSSQPRRSCTVRGARVPPTPPISVCTAEDERPNRAAILTHPVSGARLLIDLDSMRQCLPAADYRDYRIATGPLDGWGYLATIHTGGRCSGVVGPCANAATAFTLARQRVDELYQERRPHRDHDTTRIALRALQNLDAVQRGPEAVMRAAEDGPAAHAILRDLDRMCEAISCDISRLAELRGQAP